MATIAAGLVLIAALEAAQALVTLELHIKADDRAAQGASVLINGTTYRSDRNGVLVVELPPGTVQVTVVKERFAPATMQLTLAAGERRQLDIELEEQEAFQENVIVSATRTETRLADQPMRVEVLQREELEEKLMMTPGDIAMTLNEMGGMRVQTTSPSLGAASVRIQGMQGRYTRVLADGLPLFGTQVQGLGLLQIPPMDLGQVEVIKGVASALYGAGAMGGVVNLISRRPGREARHEVLVNRSSLGATDAIFYGETPLTERWTGSLLGGIHGHEQTDVDSDGWSDLPHYARAVVRPRVFWDGGGGRSVFGTVGVTVENRFGGTMDGASPVAIGHSYREALETTRIDGGATGQTLLKNRYVMTARAAVNSQHHTHDFGDVRERDRHQNSFAEVALRGRNGPHTWVTGVAVEHDTYAPQDVPRFRYAFTVPGIFVQDEIAASSWLSVAASARVDHHGEYGTFFSPRLSALVRRDGWTSRVSAGTGFYGPSFITEETEAAGLTRLTVPRPLVAERGRSVSWDVGRRFGVASVNLTLFDSQVRHPLHVETVDAYVLSNLDRPTTNRGLELLGLVRREPIEFVATYTHVRAREWDGTERVEVSLTPRHSLATVFMVDAEGRGRFGIEGYYTSQQRLDDNPYRAMAPGYLVTGFLAEWRVGVTRLFLNAENLGNVRQGRWDPLLRERPAADGRWTVEEWAPLEGRVFNGGIRVLF
jgi:outer membrane receptor for ferrienterochelin and colicins